MKLLVLFSATIKCEKEALRLFKIYNNKYFLNKTKIEYVICKYGRSENIYNALVLYIKEELNKPVRIIEDEKVYDTKNDEKIAEKLIKPVSKYVDSALIVASQKDNFIKLLLRHKALYDKLLNKTVLVTLIKRYDNSYIDIEVDKLWDDVPSLFMKTSNMILRTKGIF